MNEALNLLTESNWKGGGREEWSLYSARDCYTADPSSSPEYHVWLSLGKTYTLVMFRKKSWICLKVNKHDMYDVTVSFVLGQATIFPLTKFCDSLNPAVIEKV